MYYLFCRFAKETRPVLMQFFLMYVQKLQPNALQYGSFYNELSHKLVIVFCHLLKIIFTFLANISDGTRVVCRCLTHIKNLIIVS